LIQSLNIVRVLMQCTSGSELMLIVWIWFVVKCDWLERCTPVSVSSSVSGK